MEACSDYGLTAQEAGDVLNQVESAVAGWRDEASRSGIPEAEKSMMAPAFRT